MKRLLLSALAPVLRPIVGCVGVVAVAGCGDGFGRAASTNKLTVTITGGPTSSATSPLPLTFSQTQTFTLTIQAQHADGSIDTSFTSPSGYVRISVVPGTVTAVSGPNTSGRNVQLVAGEADNVQVQVLGVYGDARIWVEDIGYVPADPARTPPPQCANGIDDNGNGLVDFPVDPGCAFANDDTEDGGTYATGTSDLLYYVYPRIADVRGVSQGGGATPFPNEQVQMETLWANPVPTPVPSAPPSKSMVWVLADAKLQTPGLPPVCRNTNPSSNGIWTVMDPVTDLPDPPVDPDGSRCNITKDNEAKYCEVCPALDLHPQGDVVTGLSSSGFYATDVSDPRGYSSVFAYNYVAPPLMQTCDRLIAFGGTAADFFGYTEINYPAWELEAWDSTVRDCGVPEPHVFTVSDLGSTSARLNQESALVRVMTNPIPGSTSYPTSDALCNNPCSVPVPSPLGTAGYSIHIGKLMGPGFPVAPAYTPTADATNCDFNGDGKIDFTAGVPEDTCATACEANVECSEYSAYLTESQFNLVVTCTPPGCTPNDTAMDPPTITFVVANGSNSESFNPVISKGMPVGSFTGNLDYFSGGTEFTIIARCDDDIVMDPTAPPLPSDTACISSVPYQSTF